MIPALRFDSANGSLLIADLWGDTNYKPFTGVKGQRFLLRNTALLTIANAAKAQATITTGAHVIIDIIGNKITEPLARGTRLGSWSSYLVPEVGEFNWAADENSYQATHARAVKRNFIAAHPPLHEERPTKKLRRRLFKSSDISDDPTGITAIEAFLSEQA